LLFFQILHELYSMSKATNVTAIVHCRASDWPASRN